MDNHGYLINVAHPNLVKTNEYSVSSQAVRLRAYGLADDDVVQIEQQVGLAADGLWSAVSRNGNPLQLTPTNTQHLELITGIYRLTYDGINTIAVYFETDDLLLDTKLQYVFEQGCCPSSTPPTPTPSLDTQVFTSNGTWTKPAFGNFVRVVGIGGGAGGGSGRRAALASLGYGGGGGEGGAYVDITFPIAMLGATEVATVGAGGLAGAPVTVDSTDGNAGTSGQDTTFGSWAVASGGNPGAGGTATTGVGGTGGVRGTYKGGDGISSTSPSDFSGDSSLGAGGGGAGALYNDISPAGGDSGVPTALFHSPARAAGGVNLGDPGTAGWTLGIPLPGSGGGGGAHGDAVTVGGTGGIGGLYGGGGGGGGGTQNGNNSGAGGLGQAGILVVYTY